MKRSLAASLSVHGALLMAVLIGLPNPAPFKVEPQEAVQVDISNIGDVTKVMATTTDTIGITTVHIATLPYDCLWVMPQIASKVIIAPECGKVSKQPAAKAAMRCNNSGLMPAALAMAK